MSPAAPMLAVSQGTALLLLFVALPVVVGVGVMVLVGRTGGPPAGTRTSELLVHGEPAPAEVLAARAVGGFLDLRPMARLSVRVHPPGGDSFELTIVQAMTRAQLADLRPGCQVKVRYSADRHAGAIEFSPDR